MKNVHGGNIYDYNQIDYDFSANVNPLGMPESVVEIIKNRAAQACIYPDIQGRALKKQIALHDGVSPQHIVLGNGVGELIYGLCNGLRPERCLVLAPTFSEYESGIRSVGCKLSRLNLSEDDEFHLTRNDMSDLFSWIRQIKGKGIIFLCNPNNPTGVAVEKQHLLRIADVCEQAGVYLCVDESFLPFLKDETSYSLVKEVFAYKHLIVLRGFTKFYGMAGLRLGYALTSSEDVLQGYLRVLPPWNTSSIAQWAGSQALTCREYEECTRNLIEQERSFLMEELRKGLVEKVFDSRTNYILFKAEEHLKEKLLMDKILIRDCSNYANLSQGYYRIGVRTHEENQVLITALKKRLEQSWQNQL